jgi:tight adherence protein B
VLILLLAGLALLFSGELRRLAQRRRGDAVDEVRFLSAIAADLRSGSSIRSAISTAAAAESDPPLRLAGRLAHAGTPLSEVAAAIESLPVNGKRAAAALRIAEITGGRSAEVFAGLADRAMEEADRMRERRVLTAQVRFSAAVVAGLPLLAVLAGGLDRIAILAGAGPGGLAIAVVGIGMQAIGIAAVWRMATR